MVLVEPSESLAKVQPRPRGTRFKGGFVFFLKGQDTLLLLVETKRLCFVSAFSIQLI